MPFIWNLWYFRRKMTFIVVQENALLMIFQIHKSKLFELNVNWRVTPKTYLPNVNNATAFLFMREEEKLIALLHSTTTAMRLSVVFLLIPYLTWHTHTHQSIWWCHSSNRKKLRRGSREKRRMLLCWQLALQPSRENWQMLACSRPADASFPEQTAVLFCLAGSWAEIWFTNDNTLD